MLTSQNVSTEISCLDTTPIGLVATQDGRTLLAVTEHGDGMLEIVATPLTFIAQNTITPTTLEVKTVDESLSLQSSIFHGSTEGEGEEICWSHSQPSQILRAVPVIFERTEVAESSQVDSETAIVDRPTLISENPLSEVENLTRSLPVGSSVDVPKLLARGRSPGRPKKNDPHTRDVENFKCDLCHREFEKRTPYRKHMESHAEEKPHRCPKCPASFNVPTNFTLHMATHNTGEPKCPECGRKFARMASLKSHLMLHEKEESLFCTECEDAFLTKAQLDAHLKLHGEKWSTDEARKCKLCEKRFVQPALYRLHIREHYRLQTKVTKQTKRGAKHKTMYKCTICLKSFQKPSQLMRHIRVHTGEKPFKCTVCGRAFTQKSSLQIHMWRHNGIRPHTCDLCNAKFSQKGNLNAHILRVHNAPEGEPTYGCTYCSCAFKKLGSLNGHIKRMHVMDLNQESTADGESQRDVAVTEADMRATVDSVISQLASLESNEKEVESSIPIVRYEAAASASASANATATATATMPSTRKDILRQALKNSGLPDTFETKKLEARTNFVTLLDGTADTGTRKYLTIKQRCVGNVRWYACSFCHKEFKKPSDLIRHLRVHTQEKPFKCMHCCRSFALKSTMIAHERIHVAGKKYVCGSCNKTFVCQSSLANHTRLHVKLDVNRANGGKETADDSSKGNDENGRAGDTDNDPSSDKIIIRGSDERSAGSTRNHSRSRLRLSAEVRNLVPEVVLQEPLVISDTGNRICVAQVQSKRKLAYEGVADSARPHKCWVCQAAFRKISHLKQHYRRHTGERPYECTKCERKFTSNSVLKSHLHTHEDSRPYSCSICDTKFSTQSSMKRHLVTHSNKRPFMCPYCHKTFKTYVNCRKHMKVHKHELAQRQLEREKEARAEGGSIGEQNLATSPASIMPENVALTRLENIEMSFQSQLTPDFVQAFPDFHALEEEKGKVVLSASNVTSTVVDQNLRATGLGLSIDASQILQADETGTVTALTTLPAYAPDQELTPESIREIEETLNQQLFNIGINLGLTTNLPKQIDDTSTSVIEEAIEDRRTHRHRQEEEEGEQEEEADEQQQHSRRHRQHEEPVISIVYDSEKHLESTGNNIFSTQFDSFDMSQITVQEDSEIGIDLGATNTMSIPNLLPGSSKEEIQATLEEQREDELGTGKTDRKKKKQEQQEEQQEYCSTTVLNLPRTDSGDDSSNKASCSRGVMPTSKQDTSREEIPSKMPFDVINHSEINGTRNDRVSDRQDVLAPTFFAERLNEGMENTEIEIKVGASMTEPAESIEVVSVGMAESNPQESSLQCHVCNEQGFTATSLKEHLGSHGGVKEYRCTECPLRYNTNGGLNRHSRIHVGKQESKCHLCEKMFRSKAQLRSHGRIHEEGAGAPISYRNGRENDLPGIEHRSVGGSSNDDAGLENDSAVSEKVLLDTVAEREVMDRAECISGKRQRKEYTNKCKYCPKTFRKPSDLTRHTRTHTGERPYKCDYCGKSFAVKCTLDSHTKVHTGKKTLRCHVCSSHFATKGSLKVHMRLHTGSKPFRCQICDLRFRTSGHRKVHLLKHARECKTGSKRRQKHLKVAAVAEVAANLEKPVPDAPVPTAIPIASVPPGITRVLALDQHGLLPPNVPRYGNFESVGIDADGMNGHQVAFDVDAYGTVSNNNSILSVNESNQLVANLHFLLTNGLVTIQTEEEAPSADARSTAIEYHRSCESNGTNESARSCDSVCPLPKEQTEQPSTIRTVIRPQHTPNENLLDAETKGTSKGNNVSRKECDVCGKTFTKPYQVERHKRIHTGERPYKCELCAKSFAQKSTLQMHQKHHTGDRPYPCPHCEYSFTQKGNLRTHVKRVHRLDTLEIDKTRRVRRGVVSETLREHLTEPKILDLDDVSFVELLK